MLLLWSYITNISAFIFIYRYLYLWNVWGGYFGREILDWIQTFIGIMTLKLSMTSVKHFRIIITYLAQIHTFLLKAALTNSAFVKWDTDFCPKTSNKDIILNKMEFLIHLCNAYKGNTTLTISRFVCYFQSTYCFSFCSLLSASQFKIFQWP